MTQPVAAGARPGRVVAVLGMHRSGTSALAGSLEQHGPAPPWASCASAPSNPHNPKGNPREPEVRRNARGRLYERRQPGTPRDERWSEEHRERAAAGALRRCTESPARMLAGARRATARASRSGVQGPAHAADPGRVDRARARSRASRVFRHPLLWRARWSSATRWPRAGRAACGARTTSGCWRHAPRGRSRCCASTTTPAWRCSDELGRCSRRRPAGHRRGGLRRRLRGDSRPRRVRARTLRRWTATQASDSARRYSRRRSARRVRRRRPRRSLTSTRQTRRAMTWAQMPPLAVQRARRRGNPVERAPHDPAAARQQARTRSGWDDLITR